MGYFQDRSQAGKFLGEELVHHRVNNCAVIGLNAGGIIVGAEIAKKLHASLLKISIENVSIPGEPRPIGALSSSGSFTYNSEYSTWELEEMKVDYHNLIEQNRILALHELSRVAKDEKPVPKKILRGHIVILASDGFRSALSLSAAADFLKPVKIARLIVATPVASLPAVDQMHLRVDEIHCLRVVEDYTEANNYYQSNDLPESKKIAEMMERVALEWENPPTLPTGQAGGRQDSSQI